MLRNPVTAHIFSGKYGSHMFDSRPHGLRSQLVGCLTLAVVGLMLSASTAQAQQTQALTAQTLLEPFVEAYGPQYSDVETAINQMRQGNAAAARESLRTAAQKNSDLPPADIMLAQLFFRSNQTAAGAAALQEAARNNPDDPAAYVYLGEIAFQGRRFADAELLYEKGRELAERYTKNNKRKNRLLVNLHGGIASLAEVEEDWELARQELDALRRLDNQNALAMTRLGRVLFKMSKDRQGETEAYSIFKELHASNPDSTASADVNMALLYEQAGKRGNAQKMMERAVETDGNSTATRLAVAKWALDANQLPMAKENADAALKLSPESLEAKLYAGLVARFGNDLPTAEKMFKLAHLQSPNNLAANTQLALVLIDQADDRKRSEALQYAQLNARLNNDVTKPSGREAAVTLAWVLSRLGQNTNAVRTVQQAISAGTLSADSAYHAAQILYDTGQTSAASTILERTLATDSVFPNRTAAEQLMAKIRTQ